MDLRTAVLLAALFPLSSLTLACSSSDTSSDPSAPAVECSGAAPSFAKDVYPLLKQSCAGAESCHGSFGATASLARKAFINTPIAHDPCGGASVRVLPGSLSGSYIMHKLTGDGLCDGTAPMPLGRGKLPAAEIQTFADWICQGAKDN